MPKSYKEKFIEKAREALEESRFDNFFNTAMPTESYIPLICELKLKMRRNKISELGGGNLELAKFTEELIEENIRFERNLLLGQNKEYVKNTFFTLAQECINIQKSVNKGLEGFFDLFVKDNEVNQDNGFYKTLHDRIELSQSSKHSKRQELTEQTTPPLTPTHINQETPSQLLKVLTVNTTQNVVPEGHSRLNLRNDHSKTNHGLLPTFEIKPNLNRI